MCHESSGTALSEAIGVGKGTVTPRRHRPARRTDRDRRARTRAPTTRACSPRSRTRRSAAPGSSRSTRCTRPGWSSSAIRRPRAAWPGPAPSWPTAICPVRVNGDLALFAGVNRALLEREDAHPGVVLDRDFIDKYCDGFDAAATAWRALDWSQIEKHSGLSRKMIEDFTSEVIAADSVIVCWAMGLTQHRNAVATIREIVNFLLLRGNIGRPGAGAAPIRGHSNVQGDRTMGIWEQMPDTFLDKLRDEFGFEPPREHGCGHRRLDPGDARRQRRRVHRAGRQLRGGHTGHRRHRGGDGELRPDGARGDEAEPLAPVPRPRGADPAVPRPHRARRAGGGRAVRHRRGLDEHGALLARPAGAGIPAPAQRGRDRDRTRARAVRRRRRLGAWARTTR